MTLSLARGGRWYAGRGGGIIASIKKRDNLFVDSFDPQNCKPLSLGQKLKPGKAEGETLVGEVVSQVL